MRVRPRTAVIARTLLGKEYAARVVPYEQRWSGQAGILWEASRCGLAWTSQWIVTLLGIAGVSLVVFIIAELTTSTPFVNIRLYANVPFSMGCVIAFLNTIEFRGTNFLLPIMLQRIFHYSPFQTGLFFVPPALVMGVTSICTGRLSDKMSPNLLLLCGLSGLTYVSWQFCSLAAEATTAMILGLIVLRRTAQAFCHSPLTTATMQSVSEEQSRMASGLFNFHRTLAGVVGVAMTATLMSSLEEVHTLHLSQHQALYPLGTQIAEETIRSVLLEDGERGGLLAQKTARVLQQKREDAAALTGYQDLFFLFALLALLSLVPVLLLRSVKAQSAPSPPATKSAQPARVP